MEEKKSGYIEIKNLEVYVLARELSFVGWEIYEQLKWQEKKIIGDQFITSTNSVGANIVEGYRRFHYLERIKFYLNARASLAECSDHWIDLMYIRKQVSANEYQKYKAISSRLSMKLANFIAASRKAKMREEKHENN